MLFRLFYLLLISKASTAPTIMITMMIAMTAGMKYVSTADPGPLGVGVGEAPPPVPVTATAASA